MGDPVIDQAESLLAEARAFIKKKGPYFAPTIYGFIPYFVRDHPIVKNTLGVTRGMVLYMDPDWLVTKTVEELAAALVHEANHPLRDHLERIALLADAELGNIAGDLAFNPELRDAGWVLPHGVFPEDYNLPPGLILEEYYAALQNGAPQPQPKPQQGKGQPQQGQPGAKGSSGQGQPGAKGSSGQGQPGKNGQPQPGGQQPGQGSSGQVGPPSQGRGCTSGRCGGIAGGAQNEFEQKLDEEMGRTKAEVKAMVKETLQAIQNHAKANGRGSVPQSLLEEIERQDGKSKVRWQDELRHLLKKASGRIEAGGMDFSLARPSKRSPARGFPRPGLVQYLPEVAFILDTSGSMGAAQIRAAIIEAIAIFKSAGIDMAWFLQADAAVAEKRKIRLRDLMGKVRIKGRGGTNFDPAMRAAAKLKPRPDLIVYLTDGDGFSSFRPKGIEVVWCIAPGHWNRRPEVPWGHAVFIEK